MTKNNSKINILIIIVLVILFGFVIYIKLHRARLGPVPIIMCGSGSVSECIGNIVGGACGSNGGHCQANSGIKNPVCSCPTPILACDAFCVDKDGHTLGTCGTSCIACTPFPGAIGEQKKCFYDY